MKNKFFKFSELSEEAKENFLSKDYYYLIDKKNWDASEQIKDFKDFIRSFGGWFFDDEKVRFNEMYQKVEVFWFCEVKDFLNGLETLDFENDFGYLLGAKLPKFNIDRRVCELIKKEKINASFDVWGYGVNIDEKEVYYRDHILTNLKDELLKLEDYFREFVNIINKTFLGYIEAEREHLMSVDGLEDYFEYEAQDALFTEDGELVE